MMRAIGTRPFTDVHRLLRTFYSVSGTDLSRCVPEVCLNERPSVESILVLKLTDELVPTDIPDGLGELMVLHHIVQFQCLHDDDLVLVNDPSRQFVKEVLALIGNLFVFLGHRDLYIVLQPCSSPETTNVFSVRESIIRKWMECLLDISDCKK